MRKEKIEKLSLNNTIKQGLLNQLQQFLIKEEIVEVPPDLAAELASKM